MVFAIRKLDWHVCPLANFAGGLVQQHPENIVGLVGSHYVVKVTVLLVQWNMVLATVVQKGAHFLAWFSALLVVRFVWRIFQFFIQTVVVLRFL